LTEMQLVFPVAAASAELPESPELAPDPLLPVPPLALQ